MADQTGRGTASCWRYAREESRDSCLGGKEGEKQNERERRRGGSDGDRNESFAKRKSSISLLWIRPRENVKDIRYLNKPRKEMRVDGKGRTGKRAACFQFGDYMRIDQYQNKTGTGC